VNVAEVAVPDGFVTVTDPVFAFFGTRKVSLVFELGVIVRRARPRAALNDVKKL